MKQLYWDDKKDAFVYECDLSAHTFHSVEDAPAFLSGPFRNEDILSILSEDKYLQKWHFPLRLVVFDGNPIPYLVYVISLGKRKPTLMTDDEIRVCRTANDNFLALLRKDPIIARFCNAVSSCPVMALAMIPGSRAEVYVRMSLDMFRDLSAGSHIRYAVVDTLRRIYREWRDNWLKQPGGREEALSFFNGDESFGIKNDVPENFVRVAIPTEAYALVPVDATGEPDFAKFNGKDLTWGKLVYADYRKEAEAE